MNWLGTRSLLAIPLGLLAVCASFSALSCGRAAPSSNSAEPSPGSTPRPSSSAEVAGPAIDSASASPSGSASAPLDPHLVDPMALHSETDSELFALIGPIPAKTGAQTFFEKTFGVKGPYQSNQGNKELSKHFIGKQRCLDGLADIVLQTPEQKSVCGADNMVPIYKKGDLSKAKTCIDIFEYPNKACELPFVWIGPTQAKEVCELEGKRLCSDEEWVLACSGDPEGGPSSKYAYGETPDLSVCNTDKSATKYGPNCDPDSPATAWKTCATNTEPSGAFPKCRSRFGVFDQHGNVAEIMTRLDPDGKIYSQLKGSAFFYTDVARDELGNVLPGHFKPKPADRNDWLRHTYPDICAHNPRWHVEHIWKAWHVNYHLGFRCCKNITP